MKFETLKTIPLCNFLHVRLCRYSNQDRQGYYVDLRIVQEKAHGMIIHKPEGVTFPPDAIDQVLTASLELPVVTVADRKKFAFSGQKEVDGDPLIITLLGPSCVSISKPATQYKKKQELTFSIGLWLAFLDAIEALQVTYRALVQAETKPTLPPQQLAQPTLTDSDQPELKQTHQQLQQQLPVV